MTEEYIQIQMNDLSLQLTNFNGPLDLLLHLVKEDKIEIKDIFVSQVTEQFMKYMTMLDTLDIDKASEYMAMASTLLEIKSRALLPELPNFDDNAETPEKILIRQLEEYKLFKEVSEKLKTQETVDRLYKEPSSEVGDVQYTVKDMSLNNLLDAFAHILHKVEVKNIEQNNPKQIKKDSFSIVGKVRYIRAKLENKDKLDFMELCDESGETIEIVVTFIAMLELLKLQMIHAEQSDNFTAITITKNDNFQKELFEYEEELG